MLRIAMLLAMELHLMLGGVACDKGEDGESPLPIEETGSDCTGGANPDAVEVCDGIDNDCDGFVDESAVDATEWYMDADRDGWGNPNDPVSSCERPRYYVDLAGDCNDNPDYVPRPAEPGFWINPDADEVCDGIDNDCSGEVDIGWDGPAIDAMTWYKDADDDGYGDPDDVVWSCEQPHQRVWRSDDCDDGNYAVHPYAEEACNGIDDDCDGNVDETAMVCL